MVLPNKTVFLSPKNFFTKLICEEKMGQVKWMNFNKWTNFTTKRELNLRQTWTIRVHEKMNFRVHKKTNFRVLTNMKVYVSRNIFYWASFNKIKTRGKQLLYKRGKFWNKIQFFFFNQTTMLILFWSLLSAVSLGSRHHNVILSFVSILFLVLWTPIITMPSQVPF